MKNLLDLINDIRKKQAAMKQLEKDLPRIIGAECVRQIKANFVASNPAGWAARKAVTNKAYTYGRKKRVNKKGETFGNKSQYYGSVYNANSPILKQTGNLRDAIMYQVTGKTVEIGVFPNSPKKDKAGQEAHTYAKHLNEGGPGHWGKNATNTPARPFMPKPGEPPTPKMLSGIEKKYRYELNKFMEDWKK
jgi:hypothetical protein